MKLNLTLDNCFRHPLRWGKCPMSVGGERIYGLVYQSGLREAHFGRWRNLTLYFHKWFWSITRG